MSREQAELRELARRERAIAWACAKRIPARAGDAASAFARQHPVWAMGGAAALALGLMARKRRRSGAVGRASSLPMALSALGVQFLPGLLRLAGLTSPESASPDETPDETPDGAPETAR